MTVWEWLNAVVTNPPALHRFARRKPVHSVAELRQRQGDRLLSLLAVFLTGLLTSGFTRTFDGMIDEVRFGNHVLTAEEVSRLCLMGR